MKLTLMICLGLLSLPIMATSFKTQIHDIDLGKGKEDHLILLTNGQTAFVSKEDLSLFAAVKDSYQKNETVIVEIDSKIKLKSIETTGPEEVATTINTESEGEIDYTPSIISSTTASNVFSRMRRNYQNESQCYNRAHIWTYEEFQKSGLKSGKLFLFFTTRYIRRVNYKWWFHVTPYVHVNGSGQSQWRTLDRRYTGGPLRLQTWTNVFVSSHAVCPVVNRYSDYSRHKEARDCYLIPTSMYFWQPRDIENYEYTGRYKTIFYDSEVNYAYWEAF